MIIGIVVGVVVLFLLILAGISVRIVREYQRIVLFRLGRALGTRGPGLIFINPVTDRTTWVDLREQYLEIPHQTAITKDNASISIDFIIFYKVVDPSMSVLRVGNFAGAAQNVAATTLRSVVGDMPLDDVLSKREEMNASLRVRLDEVTERWGVKVTTVEVREVNPPPGVLDAMTRQMSAERTRRAAVTEAEGQKQAAITLAEGTKQSAILAAEGERQGAILRAEGLSAGLERILTVAPRPRQQHHAAPVPRDPEAGRLVALDEAGGADGARRTPERAAEHAASGPRALLGCPVAGRSVTEERGAGHRDQRGARRGCFLIRSSLDTAEGRSGTIWCYRRLLCEC